MRTLAYSSACCVVLLLSFATPLRADRPFAPITDPVAREECGACHLAFQPQMLPAKSWRTMFGNLEEHFGEDASLSEEAVAQVLGYYTAHAADVERSRNAGKFLRGVDLRNPPLRITEMPRFVREHDEVAARTWQSPSVGSKANCLACHRRADQGDYDDADGDD